MQNSRISPWARQAAYVLIYSITVDKNRLESALRELNPARLVCVVTPQLVLPDEREWLKSRARGRVEYRCFHDLLDQEDMEFCDAEADRLVVSASADRSGRVLEYYATIKRLKNERLLRRLHEEFEPDGGVVLCDDLGICAPVWLSAGLADGVRIQTYRREGLLARVRKIIKNPVGCNYMERAGETWLLIGRPGRVGQYLNKSEVAVWPLNRFWLVWFNLQILILLRVTPGARAARVFVRFINWPWRWLNGRARSGLSQLVTTIHEDNGALPLLAEGLGLDYANLQDSFLPGYYPSAYLKYRPRVGRFYIWDNCSRGIFERHGLSCERWLGYKAWRLPMLHASDVGAVGKLVYLSSGAGDWTALKNRSDEDLALEMLVQVAVARPDVTILYRPHPLWLHPEHQGMNSIDRVVAYLAWRGLPNIQVSQGALKDGQGFSRSRNLSVVSSSVDDDINSADLILGEHSQTIITAAQRGKMIVGVNMGKRPAFFGDYAALGFPLISSSSELLQFIEQRAEPGARDRLCEEYNRAVMRYNRENGWD